jgi:hypothetical protein
MKHYNITISGQAASGAAAPLVYALLLAKSAAACYRPPLKDEEKRGQDARQGEDEAVMTDIFSEVDEEVARDKVATFWSRFQTPIFVGAFLIVASTAAWTYYDSERTKAAQTANAAFMDAATLSQDGKSAEALAAFESLAKTAPKGYAALARLRAAEERAKTDRAKAMEEFESLADDQTVDRLTQEVARLRVALLTLEDGDRQKAEYKLGLLMTANGAFRFSAQEWTGLDALENGDYDEAERVFNLLRSDPSTPQSMRQRAGVYTGLLHAARGPGKPEAAVAPMTPIIEPEK